MNWPAPSADGSTGQSVAARNNLIAPPTRLPVACPASVTHTHHGAVPTTNALAWEMAPGLRIGRTHWVTADEQTAGKGRAGRRWQTPVGNLAASALVVRVLPAPAWRSMVPLLAGIALFDAVLAVAPQLARASLSPNGAARLQLKWPNDLLLDGAKLAGILIEARDRPAGSPSRGAPPDGSVSQGARLDGSTSTARGATVTEFVLGFGVNLATRPVFEDTADAPSAGAAIALAGVGAVVAPTELLGHLVASLSAQWGLLQSEARLSPAAVPPAPPPVSRATAAPAAAERPQAGGVRDRWLARAIPIDTPIAVNRGGERLTGVFAGLSPSGALVLTEPNGARTLIDFGDVNVLP